MATHEVRPAKGASEQGALLLTRIRGEYLEMPGLRLTAAQARRLWGLEMGECQRLLDTLVSARFLKRSPDGAYQRES